MPHRTGDDLPASGPPVLDPPALAPPAPDPPAFDPPPSDAPAPGPPAFDHDTVLAELRAVRRAGPVRLRALDLPLLGALAAAPEARHPRTVEDLLRRAVAELDTGTLQEAARHTLGLAPGTTDSPAADRRKRAAAVYNVSVERFRRHHELLVLAAVADEIGRLAEAPAGPDRRVAAPGPVEAPAAEHQVLHLPLRGRTVAVHLHTHSVDLLRDVDVVVSPSNVYLALAEAYKNSVSAVLRRACAVRGPTGDLIEDRISTELRQWLDQYRSFGRPVLASTVAPTGAGALERQGLRRIYHAAVAVPRPGTNDYDVQPADVTRSVTRALALLGEEHRAFDPPLRSICFPLLGAGRGGLPPETSIAAVWAAVEAELSRGAPWEIHLVVRDAARARTVTRHLLAPHTAPLRPAAS
ncbi:hypothetical protein ACFVYP_15635 [Kitasatospora sp. NPDC058201]|uniref:hypothetical protein n=1 Tax=unclassified Kitasatospora TaxID=2633591 RepID=UPI00365A3D80